MRLSACQQFLLALLGLGFGLVAVGRLLVLVDLFLEGLPRSDRHSGVAQQLQLQIGSSDLQRGLAYRLGLVEGIGVGSQYVLLRCFLGGI
jgi:hypothetical protein